MCDTFVFRGNERVPRIWFGKNSDREPNEAHEVIFRKHAIHKKDETVKCTYIEIPQAEITHDVIFCKPAWMWGAEMGVNSKGVSIGNEAVFTRGKPPRESALTGMDLLRLGLERSATAREALELITCLLEKYGQGGNCGFSHSFYYNNSFLITDRQESWVLETIGKDWVARKFETTTAISNALTLNENWDKAANGISKSRNLAAEKSDPVITLFSQAAHRRGCVLKGLVGISDGDDIQSAFNVLRSHGERKDIPTDSLVANTVCMHAGFGPVRINQTTGSMVVDYSGEIPVIWITGTSAPCLSVFRPVLFKQYLTDTVISSQDDWLSNEKFHRRMLFLPPEIVQDFSLERDRIELELVKMMTEAARFSLAEQINAVTGCHELRRNFLNGWTEKVTKLDLVHGHYLYRNAWRNFNKKADLNILL